MIVQSKTKGQVQDAISKEFTQFYLKYFGHGPKEIKAYIFDDVVFVRIIDELRAFEKALLTSKNEEDVETVKDIYRRTRERYISDLLGIIQVNTEREVLCSHHDMSTRTGERIEVFILNETF